MSEFIDAVSAGRPVLTDGAIETAGMLGDPAGEQALRAGGCCGTTGAHMRAPAGLRRSC